MRIEVNQFGSGGAVSTSFVELSQEQIQEVVKRAHDVARLRQQGQPLDAVLDGLSDVLTEAQILAAPAESSRAPAALPVTTGLVDAFAALRASARPSTAGDGTAVVSQAALDAVGDALRAAVDGGGVQEWKWKRVAAPAMGGQEVQSHDLQKVLEKMSQAAALGGAPTVREALTNHPLLFCQAFADLVAQGERVAERDAHATTVVHLDNGDPNSMVTLGAPAGMSELDVRAAVQAAVVSAGDYAGIPRELVGAGFEPIEQITVSVPAPPLDDFDVEPEVPR
ncbi:hypothetical protein [Massilia sp. X63]|uniref:hypothetical protein n=1 Tax=Massilia sp. X63 TaxID=3237285 RepID=UPI0034DD1DD8